MDDLPLRLDDLAEHTLTFGIDVHPPIEIHNERIRLNMFYEEAHARWPGLYEKLETSDKEFRISRTFHRGPHGGPGPGIPVLTFVLTNRGPVFVYPLLLPPSIEATELAETKCVEQFLETFELLRAALPNQKIMRLGMIRHVVFNTGRAHTREFLTSQTEFGKAELVGGNLVLQHRDEMCNVRIQLEPVRLQKITQLAVGKTVSEHGDYGLAVTLDVNNKEIRELDTADIRMISERATSLWPNPLLEYLKDRSLS